MSEKLSEKLKSMLSLDTDIEDGLQQLQDKCGIFGAIANGDWPTNLDVAHIICLGLVGLQHRGQESAGIVTCKWTHEPFSVHRGMGLVSQVFNEPIMMTLKGNLGIGHTRYSTMGGADNVQLAQPFMVHTSYGPIAMAHNGELVNSQALRERILRNGVGLTTGSDTELITQALSMEPPQQFKQFNFERSNSFGSKVSKGSNGSNCDNCSPNGTPNRNTSPITVIHEHSRSTSINPYAQHHMSQRDSDFVARILHLMSLTPLSYSLIVMWDECIYAIRDPFGNRPLCLGALVSSTTQLNTKTLPNNVDGWVVSSESCSFPSVCAKLYRDVQPGEIIKLEKNRKPKTLAIVPRPEAAPPAFCIFEYVYFARPDSMMEGQMVYTVRQKCGRQLAIEAPVVLGTSTNGNSLTNGDVSFASSDLIVAPVPESSIPAALGYALEAKLPYVEVFCKNRYVGRSFIQPSIKLRRLAVAKKFGPLSQNFIGKSIILIDDSIVRGTTIGQLIRLLKDAGAKEVHIRIASPPLHFPCYMGINIPTKEELVANHLKADQLAQTLGAASLVYLSIDGLKKSVQSGIKDELLKEDPNYEEDDLAERVGHCTACLTGQYPVKLNF